MTVPDAARLTRWALTLGASSGFGTHPDTYWITGNVIGVDGGEDIVG